MKSWQFVVVGAACLAAAGCRNDPAVAVLTRQNRLLEDEIHRLRWVIEDYETAMQSDPAQTAVSPEPSQAAPSGAAPAWTPPVAKEPGEEIGPGEALERLQIPAQKQNQGPVLPDANSHGNAPKSHTTGHTAPIRLADSRQVTGLVLNRRLTGGYDADGVLGDEGVRVVIEPRDDQGRWIAGAADVSLVVLDPAFDGEAARVARWDLTAAETAHLFRHTGLGPAIQLEMTWPAAPPVHSELHLFVRYTTSDGRCLEVDGPIRIELPGGLSSGWVPATRTSPPLQARRPTPAIRQVGASLHQTVTRPRQSTLPCPVWSPDRP